MRCIALIALCCASVFLFACTNHSKDYLKKSGEVASLTVPPDVPAIKQEPYFPVPHIAGSAVVKPVSLKPPTLE